MKNKKTIKFVSSSLATLLLVGGVIWAFASGGGKGELLADSGAIRRDYVEGATLIPDSEIPMADGFNGTTEAKNAAKAALDLINEERKAQGLAPLAWDDGLERAAEVRAEECSRVWSHTRPDGTEYWTANANIVYGENLARGFSSAQEAFNAWKASPTHYDNIVFGEFRTAAIAIHVINGQWYWANEFGY